MRKVAGLAVVALWLTVAPAAAQPAAEHQPAPAAGHEAAEHEGAGGHGGFFGGLVGPTINFVLLCGVLTYFFRGPLGEYLAARRAAIGKDLVDAAALRTAATEQLADLDRKLAALPVEIDALRQRGAAEIAAEEQRIAAQAAADRERLLEQTRREIDVQLRLAKRELLEHAADLSVQLATDRITESIDAADQGRLVDRYLDQLSSDARAR